LESASQQLIISFTNDKNFEITVVRTGKKNDWEWQWVLEILSEFELIVDS
jgi:hypothetical protein